VAWVGVLATFVVTALALLAMVAVVVPFALGWHALVMRSDSMAPAVSRGDVLIVSSPPPSARLGRGTVVVFAEDGRAIAHRIVDVDADGFTTKGDANAVADTRMRTAGEIRGVGRVVVPFVGLPIVWWRERAFVNVMLFVAALVSLVELSRRSRSLARRRSAASVRRWDPGEVA
jgi:signal peptidase